MGAPRRLVEFALSLQYVWDEAQKDIRDMQLQQQLTVIFNRMIQGFMLQKEVVSVHS